MTYLKRSNVSEKRSKIKTIVVLFCIASMFAVHFFFPKVYPTLLYPITSVFWNTESSLFGWFGSMGNIVFSKYSLVKENTRLKDEIKARDMSMLLLDDLKNENEIFKTMHGRTGRGNSVLGVVLVRPPISPYDTLVLDIGSADGIKQGDKVYAFGDVVIGDVAEVYSNQTKVSLFSSPGRITSILVGSSTISTQATGRGGGNFIAKLPADIQVKEGDAVILSQIRPHVFGTIEKIIVDSSDSLQTILFKIPVNVQQLRFVEVDKGVVK